MAISYSASTGGFYDSAVHKTAIPLDAVEITLEEHAALLRAQASGRVICPDTSGRPTSRAPDRPTPAQLAEAARRQRNRLLLACDWAAMPDVPMDADQRVAWAIYRQALRDVTSQPAFPQSIDWPVMPSQIDA